MIQQLRKINLLATAAMLVTFSASVALVIFITTLKTYPVKSDKSETLPLTSQDSGQSDFFERPAGLFRVQPDSPIQFEGRAPLHSFHPSQVSVINRSNRRVLRYVVAYRYKDSKKINQKSLDLDFMPRDLIYPTASQWLSTPEDLTIEEFWVDFVEFSEGDNWGPNESGARETIEGFRAGMRDAYSRFNKFLQQGQEPDSVLALAELKTIKLKKHMTKRQRGFAEGFNFICEDMRALRKRVDWQFERQPKEVRDLALRGQMKWDLYNSDDLEASGLCLVHFPPLK